MLEDTAQATEWFMQLIGIVPTDPAILARLGELYDNEGDKSQAYQYHYEVCMGKASHSSRRLHRGLVQDSAILARLGELYGDERGNAQAYQYHYEICIGIVSP